MLDVLLQVMAVAVFGMGWWPCCCDDALPCSDCENNSAAAQVQVSSSGFANNGNTCSSPADLEGTFVLDQLANGCQWRYTEVTDTEIADNTGTCETCGVTLTVEVSVFSDRIETDFFLAGGGANEGYNFKDTTFTSGDSCTDWSSRSMPHETDAQTSSCSTTAFIPTYDGSGATVDVTAL